MLMIDANLLVGGQFHACSLTPCHCDKYLPTIFEPPPGTHPHHHHSDIMDTGSTDGTQDIIRRVMTEMGKPGLLEEEPFVDFA